MTSMLTPQAAIMENASVQPISSLLVISGELGQPRRSGRRASTIQMRMPPHRLPRPGARHQEVSPDAGSVYLPVLRPVVSLYR
jgi:hypothetical protein